MKKLLLAFTLFAFSHIILAQKRVLPPIVSSYGNNEYAPKLTADGRTLLYTSDIGMSGEPEIYLTSAIGKRNWKRAEALNIPYSELIPFGSYSIAYDGSQIIFSSKRGPKIGGYDIQFMVKKENGWERPTNPGKPLNSGIHEMDPTLSADGKTIYFSRCESLDPQSGNCRLFFAHRNANGSWQEPQELKVDIISKSYVNPVILPDNKTLYFAALNEAGNYDLYMSRKQQNSWSKPKAMDFLNTEAHDRYIGVTALGDVAFIHEKSRRGDYDLFMVKVPQEFQPENVYYMEGEVTNLSDKALLTAVDAESGEELIRSVLNAEEKSFGVYLPEGRKLKVFIQTKQEAYGYYSERLDLTDLQSSKKVIREINLAELQQGEEYPLAIHFKEESASLTAGDVAELNQLIGLIKQNQSFQYRIMLYQPDSLLTDSEDDQIDPEISKMDSLSAKDSVSITTDLTQTNATNKLETSSTTSLGSMRLKAIKNYLINKGVPENLFSIIIAAKSANENLQESYFTFLLE